MRRGDLLPIGIGVVGIPALFFASAAGTRMWIAATTPAPAPSHHVTPAPTVTERITVWHRPRPGYVPPATRPAPKPAVVASPSPRPSRSPSALPTLAPTTPVTTPVTTPPATTPPPTPGPSPSTTFLPAPIAVPTAITAD